MRRTLALLTGGLGLSGLAAWRSLRRRRTAAVEGPDARAEELRRRLAETRDREPAGPGPDAGPAEPLEPLAGVEERRREVYERARAAAERMRPAPERPDPIL